MRAVGDLVDAVTVGQADRNLRFGGRQAINADQAFDRNRLLQIRVAEKHRDLGAVVIQIRSNQVGVHRGDQDRQRCLDIGMGDTDGDTLLPGIVRVDRGGIDDRLAQILFIFRVVKNRSLIQ